MPPWAAPVWERVGYSLVSTAVRLRFVDSMAARMPAPPAPTMTVSYLWICMVASAPGLLDVRVEGEDHQRAEEDGEHRGGVQQRLQPEPRGVPLGVVVDDRPQAVGAVQHRQPQHQQVPH